MMDFVRLRAMARKEWIQLRRDPRSMILAFALPLILLLFFGYAITWEVENLGLAVLDRDDTPASRALVESLVSSSLFVVDEYVATSRDGEELLMRAQVKAALSIPPGYERNLKSGSGAAVQLLLDGTDANTATIALNSADAIVTRHGLAAVSRGRTLTAPIRLETRTWYNPNLESRDMIVPGLIAVLMSIIAAMLTALTIAREWERGTMEQLASTPVSRLEVILGKLIPYLAIGAFDVALTVVAGRLIFDTPFNGSVMHLSILTLLFLVGALGQGIFISAVVKSQVLATQIALVATYLPALLLSGFMFDIASMPPILRGITLLIPARYYITVTRGIFLKGVGPPELWPQAVAMLVYAIVGLGLAARYFKKELEA